MHPSPAVANPWTGDASAPVVTEQSQITHFSMVSFALFADARLLAVHPDGSNVTEVRLGQMPKVEADLSTGHYLALSRDAQQLYVPVRNQPGLPAKLAVVDVANLQLVSKFALPEDTR